MNQFINTIFFGALQGITEFLPVSSSGHLLIFHQLFKINLDSLAFDTALHLGTLLALLLFFRLRLIDLIKKFFKLSIEKNKQLDNDGRLIIGLIIGTIPAVIAGLLWEKVIDFYLRNLLVISWTLIIGGILLIIVDRIGAKQKNVYSLKPLEFLLIGLAQALALIPGISRSGSTIIAGLGLKLQRKEAAELSFLLAIPIVLAAGAKKVLDLVMIGIPAEDWVTLILGILSSWIVGYFALKYFIKFLENYSLAVFGWYRILLGLVVLGWLYY